MLAPVLLRSALACDIVDIDGCCVFGLLFEGEAILLLYIQQA